MKKLIIMLCAAVITINSFGQLIPSLNITTQKTTSLIFPNAIKHIDIGSADVLVQKVEETENIVLVKAAKKDFQETNLSIITADGKVYVFPVNYKSEPIRFVYYISKDQDGFISDTLYKVTFSNQPSPNPDIATYAKSIVDNRPQMHNPFDESWGMTAAITGLYIKDNILFIQVLLHNQSSVNYDIDLLKLSIRDQRRAKRTASQEKDIEPLYTTGNVKMVDAGQQNVIVFAVPKFTIPEHQYLSFEIKEMNGGRNLSMKVSNRKIIRAKQLPEYD